jgi:hypothetical protein
VCTVYGMGVDGASTCVIRQHVTLGGVRCGAPGAEYRQQAVECNRRGVIAASAPPWPEGPEPQAPASGAGPS